MAETEEEKKAREKKEAEEAKKEKKEEDKLFKTGMVENMNKFTEGLKILATKIEEISKPKGDDDGNNGNDDDSGSANLETMNRSDFAKYLVDTIGKAVDVKLKPLRKDIDDDRDTKSSNDTRDLIKKAMSDHKDFLDWKKEMVEISNRNPLVSPEDAYTLARASDAKKSGEMDEKYKSEEDKEKEKREAEENEGKGEGSKFGGMLPTSGKTKASDSLDGDKAAETAWNKTFGADVKSLGGSDEEG